MRSKMVSSCNSGGMYLGRENKAAFSQHYFLRSSMIINAVDRTYHTILKKEQNIIIQQWKIVIKMFLVAESVTYNINHGAKARSWRQSAIPIPILGDLKKFILASRRWTKIIALCVSMLRMEFGLHAHPPLVVNWHHAVVLKHVLVLLSTNYHPIEHSGHHAAKFENCRHHI